MCKGSEAKHAWLVPRTKGRGMQLQQTERRGWGGSELRDPLGLGRDFGFCPDVRERAATLSGVCGFVINLFYFEMIVDLHAL